MAAKRDGDRAMKSLSEVLATLLSGAVLWATGSNVVAVPMYDPRYQEADQAPLSSSDIDAIVSPIALYPDQLVAQILVAATYPDQVTAASNYVNSSSLKGDSLMKAVDGQPWDPSVKALTQFPTVLDQMAKNLAWTSALGDASFHQPKDVMAAIQKLRQEAKAAGNLKTTQEIKVVQESPQTIIIQPANPQVVYGPQYNPTVVYGTPYNPPGYSTGALVATGLISFGVGMAIGASMNNSCCGWGWYGGGWECNWHGGTTVYRNNVYVSRSNTFYGNNRYANNPYYRDNNRPVNANNRLTAAITVTTAATTKLRGTAAIGAAATPSTGAVGTPLTSTVMQTSATKVTPTVRAKATPIGQTSLTTPATMRVAIVPPPEAIMRLRTGATVRGRNRVPPMPPSAGPNLVALRADANRGRQSMEARPASAQRGGPRRR